MRPINPNGLDLVKHFEGCQLTAYQDEVGVWTIGYGHTGLTHKDGSVHQGRTITQQQAEDLLVYDMGAFSARVEKLINAPLNDNQFAALTSFDFNTGGLESSTLRVLLNRGDYFRAANQFDRWNHAGGIELRGLTLRRASERDLFCSFAPFIHES
jgi:lysozyme